MHHCCIIKTHSIIKHNHLLYKTGIFLSVLCLIHCIAMPFVLISMPFIAKNYVSHSNEIILIIISFLLGIYLILKDYKTHKNKIPFFIILMAGVIYTAGFTIFNEKYELYFTITGSILMAFNFVLNWNLHRKSCSIHKH